MSEQQPDVEALTKTPEVAKAPATEKDVTEVSASKEASEDTAAPAAAASKPIKASLEDAPDPEEDDLDDLDDMLDEFNKAEAKTTAPETKAPAPKVAPSDENHGFGDMSELSEDDFARHLQDGMAELLGGMDGNPQLAAEFEAMMKNLTTGGGLGGLEDLVAPPPAAEAAKPSTAAAAGAASKAATGSKEEKSFQDTIQETMEKIQASGAQATAAAQEENTDDILAELMKQMSAGGLDGEGGEEDFSKMLLGMMEQLTNKDILYTPMKELNEKYPEWMKENAAKTPKEDLERYRKIEKIVGEIVAKFEEPTYKDTNVPDREYIVERMQEMQAAGSPPPDLVGDMASAQEAFGAPEEGCPQQ